MLGEVYAPELAETYWIVLFQHGSDLMAWCSSGNPSGTSSDFAVVSSWYICD